jgi:soluble lytic murein transglycosylase-like protein
MGLMQIMPETYAELRLSYHLGADPYEPRNNILAGAAFLREMHDHFGPDGLLAAYNAGPGRYEGYLKIGHSFPKRHATMSPRSRP